MVSAGPREGLLEYLDVVWGERGTSEVVEVQNPDTDYVCVATIDADKNIRRSMYAWPRDSASIVTKIFKESAEKLEVYVLPATFKTPANTKKENFKKAHTIWVDFDGNAPELWDEAKHGIPQPSMRIISSTIDRQHSYWRLDQPCFDYVELENRNRTLAYHLEADVGGWDCVQLLRPPYTTNYGYAKPDRKKSHDVIVEELVIDRKYPIGSFGVDELLVSHVSDLRDKAMTVNQLLAMNRWNEQLLDDWDHVPSADSGIRSDALVSMAHQAAELGWTSESIFSLIFHMDEKIGKYARRSDRLKRLNDIVDRVIMKHRSRKDIVVDTVERIIMSSWDIMKLDVQFNWIVEGLVPENSFGLMVSPPGLGKTTVALRMSMNIAARNDDFIGHDIVATDDTRGVLMFSLEMAAAHLKKFITDMNLSQKDHEAIAALGFYASGKELFLDTPEGRQLFEDILQQQKPRFIVIDSLNKIIRKSISDDDSIRFLTGYLIGIIQRFDLSIMVIHHDRKRQDKNAQPVLDDVYGSRFLTSETDYVVMLANTADVNELKVYYPKTRFGMPREPITIRRIDNLDFEVVEEVVASVRLNPAGKSGSDDFGEPPSALFVDQ